MGSKEYVEAQRRLMGLGPWHSITLECPDAHFVLVQPTGETVLLAAREPALPIARVALLQVWVKALDRGPASKLADVGLTPVWLPNGKDIAFWSTGGIFVGASALVID